MVLVHHDHLLIYPSSSFLRVTVSSLSWKKSTKKTYLLEASGGELHFFLTGRTRALQSILCLGVPFLKALAPASPSWLLKKVGPFSGLPGSDDT